MRLTRRFSAATFVAAVALLASCGENSPSSTTTTTPPTTDPTFAAGPLDFALSAPVLNFTYTGGANPAKQTLRITGLVALASYPQFGTKTFNPSASNQWLVMTTSPRFNNLGWEFDASVIPGALPNGLYLMTVPVTVLGARNNPQMLTVAMAVCVGVGANCVFFGQDVPGSITGASPSWNRSTVINEVGGYFYQDWRMFLQPGQSAYVQLVGSCFGYGTMNDPVVYVFETNNTFVDANDDTSCLDSQVFITNGTAAVKEYKVRATTFSAGAGNTGTYRLRVRGTPYGVNSSLLSIPEEFQEIMANKAAGEN